LILVFAPQNQPKIATVGLTTDTHTDRHTDRQTQVILEYFPCYAIAMGQITTDVS